MPSKRRENENNDKYQPYILGEQDKKIKFVREIFNLDEELVGQIEDFISQQKRLGVTMWDDQTRKHKKINKSLWAREVLTQALKDAGYTPTPLPVQPNTEKERG